MQPYPYTAALPFTDLWSILSSIDRTVSSCGWNTSPYSDGERIYQGFTEYYAGTIDGYYNTDLAYTSPPDYLWIHQPPQQYDQIPEYYQAHPNIYIGTTTQNKTPPAPWQPTNYYDTDVRPGQNYRIASYTPVYQRDVWGGDKEYLVYYECHWETWIVRTHIYTALRDQFPAAATADLGVPNLIGALLILQLLGSAGTVPGSSVSRRKKS